MARHIHGLILSNNTSIACRISLVGVLELEWLYSQRQGRPCCRRPVSYRDTPPPLTNYLVELPAATAAWILTSLITHIQFASCFWTLRQVARKQGGFSGMSGRALLVVALRERLGPDAAAWELCWSRWSHWFAIQARYQYLC
jgi:hypothetical protein